MGANPYQNFMKQSVSTMTPVQLIVALFEKSESELKKAIYYIEHKDLAGANRSITRVQDIVSTLNGSLKEKYEISESLGALYEYFSQKLLQANLKKDTEILKELLPFFTELKETFGEISKKGY